MVWGKAININTVTLATPVQSEKMNDIKKIIIIIFATSVVFNQWSSNPTKNLFVSSRTISLATCEDGSSGVFISNSSQFIQGDTPMSHPYLIRLDKYGYHVWSDPIEYGGLYDNQQNIQLLPNGNIGVISVFRDGEFEGWDGHFMRWEYTIRAMQLDNMGNQVWDDFIEISIDTLDQLYFSAVPDDAGGVYIVWTSLYEHGEVSWYEFKRIQHISDTGERLWGDNGLTLFEGDVYQGSNMEKVVKDGYGGVILFYLYSIDDVKHYRYRRIDYDGNTVWEVPARMYTSKLISDNNGGLIALGNRSYVYEGSNLRDILADVITSDGLYAWDSVKTIVDTISVHNMLDGYFSVDSIVSFFYQTRYSPLNNTYFQSFDLNGNVLIPGDGVVPSNVVIPGNSSRTGMGMIPSSTSSYLCLYFATRNNNHGLYLQKLDVYGNLLWTEDVLVSSRDNLGVVGLVPTNEGGAIIVWKEDINGTWAQQVSQDGILGEVLSIMDSDQSFQPNQIYVYQNYPNPFNNKTIIRYNISDRASDVKIIIYDIAGKMINKINIFNPTGTEGYITWDGTNIEGEIVSSGIYFYYIISQGRYSDSNRMLLLK